MPQRTPKQRRLEAARPPLLTGIGLIALLFTAGAYWTYNAPVHGAVTGPGIIAINGDHAEVRSPIGGSIERLAVHDGQDVKAGDLLLRLDGDQAQATLETLEISYYQALALQTRLMAERDSAPVVIFPPDLTSRSADPRIGEAIARQRDIFGARAESPLDRAAILQELGDVQARVFTLSDHLRTARLAIAHLDIRAPRDGRVSDLTPLTAGDSVSPGDHLMTLRPDAQEALIVKARLKPGDADNVRPGMPAEVRLASDPQGNAPKARAQVLSVSAEPLVDQATGQAYIPSTLAVDLPDDARRAELAPGMPAVAYIGTSARSALETALASFGRLFGADTPEP